MGEREGKGGRETDGARREGKGEKSILSLPQESSVLYNGQTTCGISCLQSIAAEPRCSVPVHILSHMSSHSSKLNFTKTQVCD